MRRSIRWLSSAMLLLAAIHAPGMAANPKVSLKVENATAAEAVAALSRAAGIPLEFSLPRTLPGAPVPPFVAAVNERTSFDWSGVSFARALRQLCGKYGLALNRRTGGYSLYPSGAAP